MSTTRERDGGCNERRADESAASIGNNIPGDAINFAPPIEECPTQPLHLSLREQAQLVAERSWVRRLRQLFTRKQFGSK